MLEGSCFVYYRSQDLFLFAIRLEISKHHVVVISVINHYEIMCSTVIWHIKEIGWYKTQIINTFYFFSNSWWHLISMDSSQKPQKENPSRYASILSQLIFGWSMPLLYRGSRQGLNTDDLTKCLPEDCSEELGDKLERFVLHFYL